MGAALLFAMLGVIIFGYPEGSIASGALVVWMFTFMHLNRQVSNLREEVRFYVRQMSQMRSVDVCKSKDMSVVPLSRKEEKE
jgi:hypothetical protein